MLFISFVENALKYGVMINENSEIKIMIQISDLGILFSCENHDYSFINKMNDTIKGIGLDNVRRRLELLYPNAHSLEIKNDNKKYSVLLKLFKK
jgi:LytS/YehU family sensor histidine kinase